MCRSQLARALYGAVGALGRPVAHKKRAHSLLTGAPCGHRRSHPSPPQSCSPCRSSWPAPAPARTPAHPRSSDEPGAHVGWVISLQLSRELGDRPFRCAVRERQKCTSQGVVPCASLRPVSKGWKRPIRTKKGRQVGWKRLLAGKSRTQSLTKSSIYGQLSHIFDKRVLWGARVQGMSGK